MNERHIALSLLAMPNVDDHDCHQNLANFRNPRMRSWVPAGGRLTKDPRVCKYEKIVEESKSHAKICQIWRIYRLIRVTGVATARGPC